MADFLNDINNDEYFLSQYGDDMDACDEFENDCYDNNTADSNSTTAGRKQKTRRSLFVEEDDVTAPPSSCTPTTTTTTILSSSTLDNNRINNTSNLPPSSNEGSVSLKRQLDDDDGNSSSTKRSKIVTTTSSDELSCKTPGLKYVEDFNTVTSPPSEDAELARVKMILDKKKMTGSQSSQCFTSSQSVPYSEISHQIHFVSDRTRVLKRAPVTDDYVTVTDTEGKRVYLKLNREPEFGSSGPAMKDCRKRSLHLLETSITQLRLEAESHKREKMLLKLLEAKTCYESLSRIEDDDIFTEVSDIDSGVESETEGYKCTLWVDKYSPKSYIDLLSEESTNRSLLHWLKLWDHAVFGKEKPPKHQRQQTTNVNNNNKKEFNNKGGQFTFKKYPTKTPAGQPVSEEIPEYDESGCPTMKIALLCGPPGLGKTTLAHVIAKHCGYNVVEMNASDDRSPELFKNKIEAATQMTSVLDKDHRPNCLIIDEIDGAPTPSINLLLSIIKGQPMRKKKGKNDKVIRIRRPIICICNDQYTAALRLLRQSSLILHFNSTSSRLAQRLGDITQREKLKADNRALLALCEKSDHDIRSCLNTLQFIKSEGKQLTLSMVHSSCVGLKDQQKGLFTVWQEIFTLPKQSMKAWADPLQPVGVSNNITLSSRYYNILNLAMTVGEYEKIIQGLYENFLEVKFKDSQLEAVCLGLEWIGFADNIQKQIHQNQSFTLMKYLPYIPVIFHMLYACTTRPKLHYPTSRTECNLIQQRHMGMLESMFLGMTPRIRHQFNYTILTLDIIPLLLLIIKPVLRPVNTQLYTVREKQQLTGLIEAMVTFNITYLQERTQEGQYVYNLEPNIESLVTFSGMALPKQLTYASKQFIGRQIELLKLTKHETMSLRTSTTENVQINKIDNKTIKRHEQKLVAKTVNVEACKPALDFFGRVIPTTPGGSNVRHDGRSSSTVDKQMSGLLVNVSQIWFKFNKGYSNAIRKKVKIGQLLADDQ